MKKPIIECDKFPGCIFLPIVAIVILLIGLYETIEDIIWPKTLEDYGIKRSELETRDDYDS